MTEWIGTTICLQLSSHDGKGRISTTPVPPPPSSICALRTTNIVYRCMSCQHACTPPYTHIQPQTFKHTHTHHTHASYINNHAKTNTHTIHKAPPSHSPIHTKQAPTHANLYIHRRFRDFICYEKHTHRFSAIIMNYIVNQILRN